MNYNETIVEERAAALAFGKQAAQFGRLYQDNSIVQYKRKRVREQVDKYLAPHSSILELNAGTGDDAIYFAERGHRIHATDISVNMQEVLMEKIRMRQLDHSVSAELCSFTSLENLSRPGPYDLIFSNFAGLNCSSRLPKVLSSFSPLLKPGGLVILVVLPRFCLWEFLLLFKGKFSTAFRRFSGRRGTKATIEGEDFRCWYYNPSVIRKQLKNSFDLLSIEGLCTCVPPSYIEHFAEDHPRLYRFLEKKEKNMKNKWPWKFIGDYYIISLRKKQ